MTTAQRRCLYVFLIFAVAYVGTLPLQPYPGSFAVKAIPAISLAVLALTGVTGLQAKLLFAALLFSAGGDIALGLEVYGDYFVIGLGLFLITQILYIVTFSRDFKAQRSMIPVVVVLVAFAIAMAVILTPSLGDMMLPVYVYLIVVATMGIFAALRASKSKLVLYGALFFIASDSILAINEFLTTVPAADYLIMVTYYLAQFLIVYGYVKED
jgi:uncharacterized membrane protein YhhN